MAELKISQMTQATEEQLTDGALMEVAVEDGNSNTGYSTKSGSLARLKEFMVGEVADELLANQNGGYVRKNLLKNTANSTGNFTVNSDGTVTVNGSFTSQTNLNIGTIRFDEDTRVTLNGAPAGGGTSSYALFISGKGTDSGNGATFTLNAGVTYTVVLRLYAGYTANNLIVKPMVRPATIEDGTYVPYAPSNSALNADLTKRSTFYAASYNALEVIIDGLNGNEGIEVIGRNGTNVIHDIAVLNGSTSVVVLHNGATNVTYTYVSNTSIKVNIPAYTPVKILR